MGANDSISWLTITSGVWGLDAASATSPALEAGEELREEASEGELLIWDRVVLD
jgi:hypothetical protein